MHAVRKYLERWAEPEAALARAVDRTYERALVVPACREDPQFLEGFVRAAETSSGRTLVVLVVNGPDEASAEAHAENTRFRDAVVASLTHVERVRESPAAWLGSSERGGFDVLVVDRASPGFRLPKKEGVGLARKIGTDLSLALHVAGRVRSPFIFGTDADATLPDGCFDLSLLEKTEGVAAVVLPYWHEAAADPALTRATALYELGLRHYVAGLAWAGSPYAFHTLGSATVVSAEAYAAVRGYPKREAAEDFYLLNKIAKVGTVERLGGPPVKIRSRTSDRTPFGTGASVRELLAGGEETLYAAECFVRLRRLIVALDAFVEDAAVERVFTAFDGDRAVLGVLHDAGAREALEAASVEAKGAEARSVRVHSWFDAFRTLKLVHAVRASSAPSLPWRDALRGAPFSPVAPAVDFGDPALAAVRTAYARAEEEAQSSLGPCRVRSRIGPGDG